MRFARFTTDEVCKSVCVLVCMCVLLCVAVTSSDDKLSALWDTLHFSIVFCLDLPLFVSHESASTPPLTLADPQLAQPVHHHNPSIITSSFIVCFWYIHTQVRLERVLPYILKLLTESQQHDAVERACTIKVSCVAGLVCFLSANMMCITVSELLSSLSRRL